MNPANLDHSIIEHINEKARQLEQALSSDVISYFGEIHPAYFTAFRNFLEQVKDNAEEDRDTLSIFLRTPGGSSETTDRLVTVVRHHYTKVYFIVPDFAMSAGTIFCMSGDKIFMDYSSSLGPIDPQVMVPDGSGYVAALGYLDKVQEITQKDTLSPADVVFIRGLDLAKLALYEQARNLSIDLLKQWLVEYKFKDWTHHRTTNPSSPVTQEEKEQRAEEIAAALANHKMWFSHGRALDIKKLSGLRLEIDDYSTDTKLRPLIREYNDLLSAYIDRQGWHIYFHSHLMEKF